MDEKIENNPNASNLPSEPAWRKHFWPVAIAVLVTIAILGSAFWYWQVQSGKKQKELEKFNESLQNQIQQLHNPDSKIN